MSHHITLLMSLAANNCQFTRPSRYRATFAYRTGVVFLEISVSLAAKCSTVFSSQSLTASVICLSLTRSFAVCLQSFFSLKQNCKVLSQQNQNNELKDTKRYESPQRRGKLLEVHLMSHPCHIQVMWSMKILCYSCMNT